MYVYTYMYIFIYMQIQSPAPPKIKEVKQYSINLYKLPYPLRIKIYIIEVSRNPSPSSGLHRHCKHMVHLHTCKQNVHTQKAYFKNQVYIETEFGAREMTQLVNYALANIRI